ncbi:MAG: SUMF1/EgtB/PvdO family nonheme iron enzyme [Pirellulales bacterium]
MNGANGFLAAACAASLAGGQRGHADVFGSGADSFEIDFVTIGSPGNCRICLAAGWSVPYAYRIGKYEISEQMIEKANAQAALGITKDSRGPEKPATSVSWFEATRFVNWLNTSTGSPPAYKFDGSGNFQLWQPSDAGYDPNNLFRNKRAVYFLPSADEWYKAAYYDPRAGVYWDYPTGGNSPPVAVAGGTAPGTAVYHQDLFDGPADTTQAGGLSLFGIMGQGGNVDEWEESELDRANDELFDYRVRRGGNWDSFSPDLSVSFAFGGFPVQSFSGTGFRVGSIVPETTAISITCLGLFAILAIRKERPS